MHLSIKTVEHLHRRGSIALVYGQATRERCNCFAEKASHKLNTSKYFGSAAPIPHFLYHSGKINNSSHHNTCYSPRECKIGINIIDSRNLHYHQHHWDQSSAPSYWLSKPWSFDSICLATGWYLHLLFYGNLTSSRGARCNSHPSKYANSTSPSWPYGRFPRNGRISKPLSGLRTKLRLRGGALVCWRSLQYLHGRTAGLYD